MHLMSNSISSDAGNTLSEPHAYALTVYTHRKSANFIAYPLAATQVYTCELSTVRGMP